MAFETDKSLWVEWEGYNPNATITVDHHAFQTFIDRYVTKPQEGLALLSYAKVTPKAQKLLNQYIKKLSFVKIETLNRSEQLAYWINLYNALVIKLVLEHYPIESIEDINTNSTLFHRGPWNIPLTQIKGFNISLDDIRNRIIRPIWNDPRTLYALCRGTIGSPNLSPIVFQGSLIKQQLNQAAINYINSPRGAQIINRRLIISKIFDWYEQDFGGSKQEVISHLKRFAKPKFKTQLEHFHTINAYTYNWHLNAVIEH